MTTIDISVYLDRIATLQQTCITNSVSYPTYLTQQGHDLYWVNRLGNVSAEVIATRVRRYDVTVNSLLRVSPTTATVQTSAYEIQVQQYIFDVMEYFQVRPSLTVNAEPTSETILSDLVPRTVTITSEGVQSFSEGNQSALGAIFNISFSLNVKG